MLTFAMTEAGAVFSIGDALEFRRTGGRSPTALCPVCRKELTAKLGAKVSHHFAHQPHVDPCFGSTGEGELHISAKLLLLRSLQEMADAGQELSVICPCDRCEAPVTTAALQLQPGDRAEVEVWLDPARTLKPDLTLWRGVERLALVEVLATHACGPEKLAALKKHGVFMVEVEARSLVGQQGQAPWLAPAPLPFRTALGLRILERCEKCRARDAALRRQAEQDAVERKREDELEEQRRLAPRRHVLVHCWVYLYLASGIRRELLFILVQHWNQGEIIHVELCEDTNKQVIQRWEGPLVMDSGPLLDAARAAARTYCRKSPPGPWVELDTHGGFVPGEVTKKPFQRYWWSVKQSRWVKVEFQNGLHHRLHVSPEAIVRQIQSGRIREIEVKVAARAKKIIPALEAEGVEHFERWLRQKNGGSLPPASRRRWRDG